MRRQSDQDALGHGQRAARQARARAARHERHAGRVAGAHDVADLLGRGREDHDPGRDRVLEQAVGLVRAPLRLSGDDAVLAARAAQIGQERGGDHTVQGIPARGRRRL